MIFAVVEQGPVAIDFMIVESTDGARFYGKHAFTLDSVSCAVEKAVHVGSTGGEPNFVIQWTPRWLEAKMAASAKKTLPQYALAQNPKPPPIAPPRSWAKAKDRGDRQIEYEDEYAAKGLTWADFLADELAAKNMPRGLEYQNGNVKWTKKSREGRWEEQAGFVKAATSMGGGRWRAYDSQKLYGHHIAKEFIQRNRRLMYSNPENLLWCMIFAMLTANEGTASAESNLASFAPIMKEKFARGEDPTEEDFKKSWGSGLAENKWKAFNTIYKGRQELFDNLREAEAFDFKDDDLRHYLMQKSGAPEGLGIIKFTFSLECFGQDVACLDRWMFRAIGANQKVKVVPPMTGTLDPGGYLPRFGAVQEGGSVLGWGHLGKIQAQIDHHGSGKHVPLPPWPPFSDGAYILGQWYTKDMSCRPDKGAWVKVQEACYAQYVWWENRLQATEHYQQAVRDGYENPLSYAQWRTWEDIMRHHTNRAIRVNFTTHSPLWVALTSREEYNRTAFDVTHKHLASGKSHPEKSDGGFALARGKNPVHPYERAENFFVNQLRVNGYLSRIEKKFGIDLSSTRVLACGASACVWDLHGKVWKVTQDGDDAAMARMVLDERLDEKYPLVRVHSVCRLDTPHGPFWIIVADRLSPLTVPEMLATSEVDKERSRGLHRDWGFFSSPAANQVYGSDLGAKGVSQDEVDRVLEAWRGLARLDKDLGVNVAHDAHAGNWGRDALGRIRLFDFGYSGGVNARKPEACRLNPRRRNAAYPEREERILIANPAELLDITAGKLGDPMGVVKGAQLVPLWPSASRKTWGKVGGPADVWNLLKTAPQAPFERMYCILLDRRNAVLGVFVAGRGTSSEAIVGVKEVFAPAIEARASAIILAHNHPSGDPAPSQADIALTERMQKVGEILGIALLDSMVLGSNEYRSLRDDGLMDGHLTKRPNPQPKQTKQPGIGRVFSEALAIKEGRQKSGTQAAQRLSKNLTVHALREFAKHE